MEDLFFWIKILLAVITVLLVLRFGFGRQRRINSLSSFLYDDDSFSENREREYTMYDAFHKLEEEDKQNHILKNLVVSGKDFTNVKVEVLEKSPLKIKIYGEGKGFTEMFVDTNGHIHITQVDNTNNLEENLKRAKISEDVFWQFYGHYFKLPKNIRHEKWEKDD